MTIPSSHFVNAQPGVLIAGGSSLALSALYLTENLAMPTGTVLSFASLAAVQAFFGVNSAEAAQATIYFAGFVNSSLKPGAMLFFAYNVAARAGFIQGGSLAGLSLAQLQALTGTLTINFAGAPLTSSSINLSAASSFSNAATIIQADFTSPGFTVTWNAVASAFVVTSTATGAAETIVYATGTIAAGLKLTQATGALLSQGAAVDTPASVIASVLNLTQNWSTLVTMFEPSLTDKEAFAAAINAQNDQYLYDCWDSDPNASVQGNQTCLGFIAQQNNYASLALISGDPALAVAQGTTLAALALNAASFLAGAIASINFSQPGGRTNLAFRSATTLAPTCANLQIALNLEANGYNYYGAIATRNQGFTFFYKGLMAGSPFLSIVRYVNQIWLNSQFDLQLLSYLTAVGSVGYEPADFTAIRNVLTDPIDAAISFGAIRTNVTLSAIQIAALNAAAGVNAASQVQAQGFYLQILDPGAPARALGQTPIINFWYTDGGDILQIFMDSTDIL